MIYSAVYQNPEKDLGETCFLLLVARPLKNAGKSNAEQVRHSFPITECDNPPPLSPHLKLLLRLNLIHCGIKVL